MVKCHSGIITFPFFSFQSIEKVLQGKIEKKSLTSISVVQDVTLKKLVSLIKMAKRFENKVGPESETKSGDDESSIQTISIGEGKSQSLTW